MHFAFYISSHGHGHAVRESFLINELPEDIHVSIISTVEESFFQDEIERAYTYRPISYDSGVVQEDALVIDVEATIAALHRQTDYNNANEASEIAWLQSEDVTLVISDSVPWVATLAQKLSIPSALISNFTWVDILEPFLFENPSLKTVLKDMTKQLKSFSHVLELAPTMESVHDAGFGIHRKDKILFREGFSRPEELREHFEISASKKIGLIYVGAYGIDEADWHKLEEFSDWHFLSLYDIPYPVKNFTKIDKSLWTLQDFSASVDVMIAKLGYNTVIESLVSGTPLLYIPRLSFSESYALEEFVSQHGASFAISEEEFRAMSWEKKLYTLSQCKEPPLKVSPVKDLANWLCTISEEGIV